jgi:hypothetical protein
MRSIITGSVRNATAFISVPHFGDESGPNLSSYHRGRPHPERLRALEGPRSGDAPAARDGSRPPGPPNGVEAGTNGLDLIAPMCELLPLARIPSRWVGRRPRFARGT